MLKEVNHEKVYALMAKLLSEQVKNYDLKHFYPHFELPQFLHLMHPSS